MEWTELLKQTNINNIRVKVINPVRIGDEYKSGDLSGFKAGIYGGGGKKYRNGFPRLYCSLDRHWIRKPKVLVAYDCFTFGRKQHFDWIDVDNCEFEIKNIT